MSAGTLGFRRPLDAYSSAMEAGGAAKLRAIMPWIHTCRGGTVLDIGAGTGLVAAAQARRARHATVIAVDVAPPMLAAARRRYGDEPNLRFRQGSANEVDANDATSVVLSSVLHEVYSQAGFSLEAVACVLQVAWQSLRPGGRLIIRDFVRPLRDYQRVLLRHHRHDIVVGHDFSSFARSFWLPLVLDERSVGKDAVSYMTDLGSASEFLLRKDYHAMWDHELQERYGFWTWGEALTMVRAAGFHIVHCRPLTNNWLAVTSFRNRVQLLDPGSSRPLDLGSSQLLLVAEKRCCQGH